MESPATAKVSFRASPAAWETVSKADMFAAVERHRAHDWADQSATVRERNEKAVIDGERLFSVHFDRNKVKFFVTSSPDYDRPLVSLPKTLK